MKAERETRGASPPCGGSEPRQVKPDALALQRTGCRDGAQRKTGHWVASMDSCHG